VSEWLARNNLSKFAQAFADQGVRSLEDLCLLQTDTEVSEFVGSSGVNMGVITQR